MARAISQIPVNIPYQSYFSSTLYEKALLSQRAGDLIVSSTKVLYQGSGRLVALAGWSETPIAFRFSGTKSDTGVIVVKPGQILDVGHFDGFEYGLPFGWLGGGRSMIYTAHTKDALIDPGSARPEVIFHRLRQKIVASAGVLPAITYNWPLAFPWKRAVSGATSIDQTGTAMFRVEPTRSLIRLRMQNAVPKTVGLFYRGARELDEASDGTMTLADVGTTTWQEIVFNVSTDPLLKTYPLVNLGSDFIDLTFDDGGVTFVNLGDATLSNIEVDIVRYGRI